MHHKGHPLPQAPSSQEGWKDAVSVTSSICREELHLGRAAEKGDKHELRGVAEV